MQKSLRLVLQSKSTYDENWIDRIESFKKRGGDHLGTRYEEIFLLKKTIAKDRYPIVVYSVSNFSVVRKRNFSIITKNHLEMLPESRRPFRL